MKNIIGILTLLLCAAAATVSCDRRDLCYDCAFVDALSVPIRIDWDTSGVVPQNVTILFYNSYDGELAYEHVFEHNSEPIQSYVYLAEGSYTAVVFNELRDQIDHLSCFGHQNLSTLRFEGHEDEPLRTRAQDRKYIKQSGDLAVAMVENIVVTEDMIVGVAKTKTSIESLMGVVPLKKNTTIEVTAHIKNIYYARMPVLVDLVNLAEGYYVSGDKNGDRPSSLQFTMNNRVYDKGSYYDGTISTSISTFGSLVDRGSTSGHDDTSPIILDLLFKMVDVDQSELSLKMDVTRHLKHERQSDGSMLITIDVSFDDELSVVEPDGSDSDDSGFGAQVEDWDDVDVPLKQ